MRKRTKGLLALTLGTILLTQGFVAALFAQEPMFRTLEKAPKAAPDTGKATFQEIPVAPLGATPALSRSQSSEAWLFTPAPAASRSQPSAAQEVAEEPIQELPLRPLDPALLVPPALGANASEGQEIGPSATAQDQAGSAPAPGTSASQATQKMGSSKAKDSDWFKNGCQAVGYGLMGVGGLGAGFAGAANQSHENVSPAFVGISLGAALLGVIIVGACGGDLG